jgi:hypothetical protein
MTLDRAAVIAQLTSQKTVGTVAIKLRERLEPGGN